MQPTQQQRERSKLDAGREKILKSVMEGEAKGKANQPYMGVLYGRFLLELAQEIRSTTSKADGKGKSAQAHGKFATYVGSLDPNIVALRAIEACVAALCGHGAADTPQPVYRKVAAEVGRAIHAEYMMVHFQKLSPPLFNTLLRNYRRSMSSDERRLVAAFKAEFTRQGFEFPVWEFGIVEAVGEYLLGRLAALGFIEKWTATGWSKGRPNVQTYIAMQQDVRSLTQAIVEHVAALPRAAAPLVEPPLDWSYRNVGGGFHTEDMQRLMAYAVQGHVEAEQPKIEIDALNYLQQVRWQINAPVLDIVKQAALLFDFGDVVSANPGPKPPISMDATPEQVALWKPVVTAWYTDKKTRAAKYLKLRKVLTEADELRDYPTIWFAYYADFRGRKYARASGVSPQGTDLDKGLIQFAEGKPIRGERAEFWFKVHGANKFGIDKVSFEDRIKWVEENHESILASARSPLDERWWAGADCPVQFLAWSMEYAEWDQYGAAFHSHIPVSMDGTCNGLQNFSALLRDEVGGSATNLLDGPVPRDIYGLVAERTTEILQALPPSVLRDAWLAHGINRKVTKRTTMTLPYGCTRYAAAEFIVQDYLVVFNPPEIDKASYGDAGNFLSHIVWAAIGDVVVKAREAMDWLKGWAADCVKRGKRVEWYTPTGLLVRSEYQAEQKVRIKSVVFNSRMLLTKGVEDKLDSRRVQNAVSPNFIHSMDGAHLTAICAASEKAGIQLAAIHDDFGTHAADTDELATIIRRTFVEQYRDQNWLQRLADLTGYDVPPPNFGNLNLVDVLDSPYFFA